jgi:hypothetical protein
MGVLQDENDNHNNRATTTSPRRKQAELFKVWVEMPSKAVQEYVIQPLETVEARLQSETQEINQPYSPMSRTYIDDSGNLTKTTLNYNDSESARPRPRESHVNPPL